MNILLNVQLNQVQRNFSLLHQGINIEKYVDVPNIEIFLQGLELLTKHKHGDTKKIRIPSGFDNLQTSRMCSPHLENIKRRSRRFYMRKTKPQEKRMMVILDLRQR